MTAAELAIPAVAEMYEVAHEVLGYDLKKVRDAIRRKRLLI